MVPNDSAVILAAYTPPLPESTDDRTLPSGSTMLTCAFGIGYPVAESTIRPLSCCPPRGATVATKRAAMTTPQQEEPAHGGTVSIRSRQGGEAAGPFGCLPTTGCTPGSALHGRRPRPRRDRCACRATAR